ncbi:MAG: cysteine rich repeat-containing protein [Hyphomicrobiaceae bacterium]
MLKRIIPLVASLTMLAAAAVAQAPGAGNPDTDRGASLRAACKADMDLHCKGLEAGGGRRVACLAEKKDQLSPACKTALDQRKGGRNRQAAAPGGPAPEPAAPGTAPGQAATTPAPPAAAPSDAKGPGAVKGKGRMAVCRTDVATFCQSAEKGGGARMACLRQNIDKLDPACRAALNERAVERKQKGAEKGKESRQACREDRKALCGDVQAGGGQIVQCLKSNADKLSPGCRDAILR